MMQFSLLALERRGHKHVSSLTLRSIASRNGESTLACQKSLGCSSIDRQTSLRSLLIANKLSV